MRRKIYIWQANTRKWYDLLSATLVPEAISVLVDLNDRLSGNSCIDADADADASGAERARRTNSDAGFWKEIMVLVFQFVGIYDEVVDDLEWCSIQCCNIRTYNELLS